MLVVKMAFFGFFLLLYGILVLWHIRYSGKHVIKCEHSENKEFNRNVHNWLRKKLFWNAWWKLFKLKLPLFHHVFCGMHKFSFLEKNKEALPLFFFSFKYWNSKIKIFDFITYLIVTLYFYSIFITFHN